MIFVDANAFIGILNRKSSFHQQAIEKSERLKQESEVLVTSDIVVAETITVLSSRIDRKLALVFGSDIEAGNVQIFYLEPDTLNLAWQIFQTLTSKNVSFFDCTSFAIIEKYKLSKVFSFDSDFQKYGKKLGWEFV